MTLEPFHYLIFGYILLSILAYTLFYYAPVKVQVPRIYRTSEKNTAIALVVIQRTAGFLLFGGIPVLLMVNFSALNSAKVGLTLSAPWQTALFTLVTILLIIPFNYINAKQPETQKHYPQIRVNQWNLKLFSINSALWMLYLWGYEFFFRGFLFFISLEVMALHWAILLNIVLYALAHWPKGWREVLGALPFGLLLCVVTHVTGNCWYAFLVHCFLAISVEWFAIQVNPEMALAVNKQQTEKNWR